MDEKKHLPGSGNDGTGGISSANSHPSVNQFTNPGIILFIDQLLVAVGGWIFWLPISKIASASDIGDATAIYSLVLIINTVIQFGLEYPLLKKSTLYRSHIFGTVILIELAITAVAAPIVFHMINSLYQQSVQVAWLGVGILIFSSASFIARFALLGLSNAKSILIFDLVGTVVKFTAGFTLVSAGYGASGILLSFLLQAVAITGGTLYASNKLFGFKLGDMRFAKEIIKEGLLNMPSKLSGMVIMSLSVILLALFGVASSEVGIFYISMMISLVAGSFASSLAYMVIPASSVAKADMSLGSLRIGLSFTAPIISALIVAPASILSILGAEYVKAADLLVVLAVGILPSVILSNAMSKFNNLNEPKRLLTVGSVRLVGFLITFFVFVPQYGSLGAAYSILVSFTISALLSLKWSERDSKRYIAVSILSILAALILGRIIEILFDQPVAAIMVSICASFAVILITKCTDVNEIKRLIGTARGIAR